MWPLRSVIWQRRFHWAGETEAGQRIIQKRSHDCWAGAKGLIVKLNDGVSECSYVDVHALGNGQLAGIARANCCHVFDEICVDSQFKVKSCSEDLNGGSGLDSHAKRGFECS